MWRRFSDCPICPPAERLWHAGLNQDGSRCILFGDCPELPVWDVPGRCVEHVYEDLQSPQAYGWHDLRKVLQPGDFYVIRDGPCADRYRVFGIDEPGRTVDAHLGLRLEIDQSAALVRVRRLGDGVQVDALTYEWVSGAYAVASFAEDGGMFAVLEPYHATFFHRLGERPRSLRAFAARFAGHTKGIAAAFPPKAYLALLPLLEFRYPEVRKGLAPALARAGLAAEGSPSVSLRDLVLFAVRHGSPYWSALALGWIEAGLPLDHEVASAIRPHVTGNRAWPQELRQQGFRLLRRWGRQQPQGPDSRR
jgi:hypothetical protein